MATDDRDEAVEAAEAVDRGADRRIDRLARANIDRHGQRSTASRVDLVAQRAGTVHVEVSDGDAGATICKRTSDRAPVRDTTAADDEDATTAQQALHGSSNLMRPAARRSDLDVPHRSSCALLSTSA
jgi:hypothetical protein